MIDRTDVGCWIVKGDPHTWDYFRWLEEDESSPVKPHVYPDGWTLGHNYRNEMIEKGDLIALWITGPKKPGIYEFGWVTSDEPYEVNGFDDTYALDPVRARQSAWAIDFAAVRLRDHFLPRPEMKADPVLSGCEQFRAPQGANPSYLTPDEAKALAQHLASRVPASYMRAAKWDRLQ